MTKAPSSRQPQSQRASRLSRDLLVKFANAGDALDKAHALAMRLQKAAPGASTARLAGELAAQIETAKKALSQAGGPPPARSAARRPARRRRRPGPTPGSGRRKATPGG
ncbi:MAG TPA: hypothetical protein VL084_00715 [Thermoanaerobaculia bacterium]|nr:hypothetical protein [Thermoanaerobaculia bacterium]